jgi:hypothetical protein
MYFRNKKALNNFRKKCSTLNKLNLVYLTVFTLSGVGFIVNPLR